jgi:hypothetical protein
VLAFVFTTFRWFIPGTIPGKWLNVSPPDHSRVNQPAVMTLSQPYFRFAAPTNGGGMNIFQPYIVVFKKKLEKSYDHLIY